MAYDPFTDERRLRGKKLIREADSIAGKKYLRYENILALKQAGEILAGDLEVQAGAVLATVEQTHTAAVNLRKELPDPIRNDWFWQLIGRDDYPWAGMEVSQTLLRRKLPLSEKDLVFMLETLGSIGGVSTRTAPILSAVIALAEKDVEAKGSVDPYKKGLRLLRDALSFIANAPERKLRERAERLLVKAGSKTSLHLPLHAGEAWADAARAEIGSLEEGEQRK